MGSKYKSGGGSESANFLKKVMTHLVKIELLDMLKEGDSAEAVQCLCGISEFTV